MQKQRELSEPKSCWNKAGDHEILFILLGRDLAAPDAIRNWVAKRLALGLNNMTDPQIKEALDCADNMEAKQRDASSK